MSLTIPNIKYKLNQLIVSNLFDVRYFADSFEINTCLNANWSFPWHRGKEEKCVVNALFCTNERTY